MDLKGCFGCETARKQQLQFYYGMALLKRDEIPICNIWLQFSILTSHESHLRSLGLENHAISHLQTSVSKFYFLFMFVPQCLVLYDLVRCDPQAVCKHCVHISTAVCSGQDVKFVVCAGRRRVCCGRDVD